VGGVGTCSAAGWRAELGGEHRVYGRFWSGGGSANWGVVVCLVLAGGHGFVPGELAAGRRWRRWRCVTQSQLASVNATFEIFTKMLLHAPSTTIAGIRKSVPFYSIFLFDAQARRRC
jgi:hypothetical protein